MSKKRPPVVRRPMSSEEQEMAKHLGNVSFAGNYVGRRFAQTIAATAAADNPEISERECAYLRGLVYTYRRQIPRDVVSLAGDVPTQRRDFAAQQAWRDEQVKKAEEGKPQVQTFHQVRKQLLEQMDAFGVEGSR